MSKLKKTSKEKQKLSHLLISIIGIFHHIKKTDNNGIFCYLNCFRSYTTENRLIKHKTICENHDYCCVEMPEEDIKY